jgi:hypothetical protein
MRTDAEFLAALDKSQQAVSKVANWLFVHKYDVLVKPYKVRPSVKQAAEYADDGDIEIRLNIEVKQRSFSFTCANDYPYSTVLIDHAAKINSTPASKLYGYVIVDDDASHACFISASTRSYWTEVEHSSAKHANRRLSYCVPKEWCKFTEI